MPKLLLNGSEPSSLYLGGTKVSAAYLGGVKVWPDEAININTTQIPFPINNFTARGMAYGFNAGYMIYGGAGGAAKIYHTTDFSSFIDVSPSIDMAYIYSMSYNTTNSTWMAGGTSGRILLSSNNGGSWSTVTIPGYTQPVYACYYANYYPSAKRWLVTVNNSLLQTTDMIPTSTSFSAVAGTLSKSRMLPQMMHDRIVYLRRGTASVATIGSLDAALNLELVHNFTGSGSSELMSIWRDDDGYFATWYRSSSAFMSVSSDGIEWTEAQIAEFKPESLMAYCTGTRFKGIYIVGGRYSQVGATKTPADASSLIWFDSGFLPSSTGYVNIQQHNGRCFGLYSQTADHMVEYTL